VESYGTNHSIKSIKNTIKSLTNNHNNTENKHTKSKYFQFIDNNLVSAQVISYNGTIIPLPKRWSNQEVEVIFSDGIGQRFYVRDNGNISYVSVAKIYLGSNVTVSLKPDEQKQKEKEKETIINNLSITVMASALGLVLATGVSLSITHLIYL
jgi:hypothetical protein